MKDYEDNAAASPLPPPHTPSGAATASQTNSQILEEMTSVGINADSVNMDHLTIQDQTTCVIESQTENFDNGVVEDDGSNVQVACFSDTVDNATLHFQIIRLQKQIYAWIGCDSAKFGNLYAAAPTRPSNTVSVASLIGGTSDNTGSSIARRLVLRTGLPIVLSSNISKNNPTLEADAEKKLIQKLISLGYTQARSQ